MTLLEAELGAEYRLESISLEAHVQRRMEMLGMTHHAVIRVLGRKKNGAVIFTVRGTRFAVGRRFAAGIQLGGGRHE